MAAIVRLLLLLSAQCLLAFALHNTVARLESFRVATGGFRDSAAADQSLSVTADALLLSHLYGVNITGQNELLQFVNNLRKDNGFSDQVGTVPSLEATRRAVEIHQLLGSTEYPAGVSDFVQSAWDSSAKLYANRAGEKGDVQASADALQVLATVGALDKAKSNVDQIKKHLEDHTSGDHFTFGSADAIADNYYGVLLAKHTGFQFKDPQNWVKWVVAQQKGGWGSLSTTAAAIKTLALLQAATKLNAFANVDAKGLEKHVISAVSSDVRSAALGHSSLALAGLYGTSLDVQVAFATSEGNVIKGSKLLQGVQVRPAVAVGSVARRQPHTALKVTVTAAQKTGAPETLPLSWDETSQIYITDQAYDTQKKFGPVTFTFTVSSNVPTLGDVSFTRTEERQIGYEVRVKADANLAGKPIKPNENVALGTEFTFGVTLRNNTVASITRGDFVVAFRVLDSADVVIDEQSSDRSQTSDPLKFAFSLKSAGIPAGRLVFVVSVTQAGATEPHSQETVAYNFAVQMVATNIAFANFAATQAATYKLGEKVALSVDIASLADLRTPVVYERKHLEAVQVFADLNTAGGKTLESLKPAVKNINGKDRLSYEFTIPSTFEWVGAHFVTFRYVSPHGSTDLQNYDSSIQELYEEPLNFTVKADLRLTDLTEKPQDADFHYGNVITLKFRVKDQISGGFVWGGKNDVANVYLLLKQQQPRGLATLYEPATTVADKGTPQNLLVRWNINPNAAAGNGQVSIVAQDADGNLLPVLQEKDNKPLEFQVKISGEINVASQQYTEVTSTEAVRSVFIVQLNLTCKDKPLKDAQLGCVVTYTSKSGVEHSFGEYGVVAGTKGGYQVSWAGPHKQAPSGSYHLRFYRAKDLARAAKESEADTKPLFEVSFYHESAKSSSLPIKTELIATLLLLAAFLVISNKKLSYSK